jgi:hypothetical protein
MDTTGAVRHRLRRPMIEIVRGKQIDNEIHVGGMRGVERACT